MNYAVEQLILPSTVKILTSTMLNNYDRVKRLTISHDFWFDNDCAGAFGRMKSLKEFHVSSPHLRFFTEKGILYTRDADNLYKFSLPCEHIRGGKILVSVPPAYPLEDFVVPEDVVAIYWGAFNGCRFKTITLPDNLEVLDCGTIRNVADLKCIKIPNKVFWTEGIGSLIGVKYESKDGSILDEEVCELWDFWTTKLPTHSHTKELGKELWCTSLNFSRSYTYPNEKMSKTIKSTKTGNAWIENLESLECRFGEYASFMKAMLFLELDPYILEWDTEEEAIRLINAIWGSGESAKEFVLKLTDASSVSERWYGPGLEGLCGDDEDIEDENSSDKERYDYAMSPGWKIRDEKNALDSQETFITAQLATSAPMLFLDRIGKWTLHSNILVPMALSILNNLVDTNDPYVLSNFICAYYEHHHYEYSDNYDHLWPKYGDVKKAEDKALIKKDICSRFNRLQSRISSLEEKPREITRGQFLEIKNDYEACMHENAFTAGICLEFVEEIRQYAQNQWLWVNNNMTIKT